MFQVHVGNLVYKLGEIEYHTNKVYFPLEAIIGIAAGGTFLIIIIIIIIIMYQRKSNRAEKEYQKIQLQLDTLESNVRNECKQGKELISL